MYSREKACRKMLPPALAETIPNLPAVKEGKTVGRWYAVASPASHPLPIRPALQKALAKP